MDHKNAGLGDVIITAFLKESLGNQKIPLNKRKEFQGKTNNLRKEASVDLESGIWILKIEATNSFPKWKGK